MSNQITIKDMEPVRVAYKSYKGNVLEAGKHMPSIFKSIKGKNNGTPFFTILSVDESTGVGELDLCVPTMETPNANDVFIKEMPRIHAVSLIHQGGYDRLPESYEKITKYVDEHGLTIIGPCREVYVKGPGPILKGNPDNYITEILLPIEESK